MARPTVAVIGTGGTISSLGHHSLELATYVDHATVMEVDDLIAKVPELDRVADIVPVPFRAIPSTAMGPAVWPELLAIVHETAARPEIDGIAITHGTATLEETAYFLNLTVET
ncbi:MAG: asparaginase domain-containing protein, partial [Alphaproteobacteria bacterium]|nr:asparaginase domain-containing protein [Alphaproteobacteria bacterium]